MYRLDGGAFYRCDGLRNIHIPAELYQIDDLCNPFEKCSHLESITVDPKNDSLYSFDGMLFDDYGYLLCCPVGKKGAVILPNTCHGIDRSGFSGCDQVTSLILPESDFYYIGYCAFDGCKSLEELTIPKSIHQVDERAFFNCSKLKRITLPTDENVFYSNEFNLSPFENCRKSLVIAGIKGSFVEAYCKEQKIKFESIAE